VLLLVLCSELSWPLDIAPNAHNIGLHAIQTSTPRNADCVLPPLKTPATDFNPYFQASATDEQYQVSCYQRNEAEDSLQLEAQPKQFTPQPHMWPDENDGKNFMLDDTVRQADFDRDEDNEMQYVYVDQEGHRHFANMGQMVMDQGHPIHTGPMLTLAQQQQNAFGQICVEHQWSQQQMYALEQQDVTDATQLQTAEDRNGSYDNTQVYWPYSEDHRVVNAASQPQWQSTAAFSHAVSHAAQPDHNPVGTSVAYQNNMASTWLRTVAPQREASVQSPTTIASKGDGGFGGYQVQYRLPGRDQFHTVSAAGDGCQKLNAEQADSQSTAAKSVTERLQQAFLQPGKWLLLLFCRELKLVSVSSLIVFW